MDDYENLKNRKTPVKLLEDAQTLENLDEIIRYGEHMKKQDIFNAHVEEDDGLVTSIMEYPTRVSPLMRSAEIGAISLGLTGYAFGAYIGYDVSEGCGLFETAFNMGFDALLAGTILAFGTVPVGMALGGITHGVVRGAQAIKGTFSNKDKEINHACECYSSI